MINSDQLIRLCNSHNIDHLSAIKLDNNEINDLSINFDRPVSVLSAAIPYELNNADPTTIFGYVAPYTVRNYYKILSERLKAVSKEILKIYGIKSDYKKHYRVFTNSIIDDKKLGLTTSLGFIGRNTLLLPWGIGSNFVIGHVIIDLELPQITPKFLRRSCGNCRACIDACPTGAICENGTLDKAKCIHELSNSDRWPDEIAEKKMIHLWGKRLFGCSRCVEVCPLNQDCRSIEESIGYIGEVYDPYRVIEHDKSVVKKLFAGNQLSLSWINSFALIRNALTAILNNGDVDTVKQYINSNKNGLNSNELDELNKIFENLNF